MLEPLRLERAYYLCAACGRGFWPRDQTLGFAAASLSPGLLQMVAQVGAMVSFEEGADLLATLAGVTLDAKHVERAAGALVAAIAEEEQRRVDDTNEDYSAFAILALRCTKLSGRLAAFWQRRTA